MSRRRLARSYAAADLEDLPAPIPTPTTQKKRKRTANDTEYEDDDSDSSEPPPSPPMLNSGQTPASNSEEPVSREAGTGNPRPIMVRGKVLPPRPPQPGRTNRNNHPGMIDASRPKRTSAEVAVATKSRADLQRQADELEQKRRETLAKMELQEERDEEAEENAIIRNRGDASRLDDPEDVDMHSADGADKVPIVADAGSEFPSSEDDKARPDAPKRKQRKKKVARGETRAAVDIVKEKLKAVGKRGVEPRVEHQRTSNQKMTKAKTSSPLLPDWQSELSAPSRTKSKAKVSEPKAMTVPTGTSTFNLNDDEVSDTFSPETGRNHKNATEDVVMRSASEDESDDAPRVTKVKPKTVRKSKAPTLEAKLKQAKSKPHSVSSTDRASPAANSSAGNSDFNSLPEFARSAWSTSFLPTLYDRLGQSPDPFVIEADMVKAIQEMIDLAYPDTDYQVRASDKIFIMAKDRLSDKRAFIGRQGIKIVSDFFKDEEYIHKPKAIANYAKWATRGDGPAVFGIPSPIDRIGGDYVKPQDIFESKFVIQLLAQYLKWTKGSRYGTGRPFGAIAMVATAIERGFLTYATGVPVDQGLFSRDVVGTVVGEYADIAQRLSDRRWNRILLLCGAHGMEQKPNLNVNSLNRRALYVRSSPTKASESSDESDE